MFNYTRENRIIIQFSKEEAESLVDPSTNNLKANETQKILALSLKQGLAALENAK